MSEVKEKLDEYIKKGYYLIDNSGLLDFEQEFESWKNVVLYFLQSSFIERIVTDFKNAKNDSALIKINNDFIKFQYNESELKKKLGVLNGLAVNIDAFFKEKTEKNTAINNKIVSNKIFIVHGRDEGLRESAARFIEKLELKPVILSEQSNFCYTVIEKFEKHADESDFAVVLFTPDDIGGLQEAEEQKNRARQNVIFELGYFLGKLGRDKVCLLYKGDTEIPSDIQGVTYISMDSNNWKMDLCKSLKSAGFTFDANKVFE